jgi:hypothetical protein
MRVCSWSGQPDEAMNLLDHLRRMAGNNRWSNDRLHRAVLSLKPGEFEAPRISFFPSIKATLNHIVAVDRPSISWKRAVSAPPPMTISCRSRRPVNWPWRKRISI